MGNYFYGSKGSFWLWFSYENEFQKNMALFDQKLGYFCDKCLKIVSDRVTNIQNNKHGWFIVVWD